MLSNYGETTTDLAAPGDDILSTVPDWAWMYWWRIDDYYAYDGGTSMAAPHVAGTASLLWSYAVEHGLGLTLADIKDAILNTVDHSAYLEGYVLTEGRLNTYEALKSIIPSEITVTYDANGGTGEPSPDIGLPGEPVYLSLIEPMRGYCEYVGFTSCEFLGWAASPDAITPEYQPGDPVIFFDDTTLYAVWKGIDIVNVHYVDIGTNFYEYGIGFDLVLLNIEPGSYYMDAYLKVYKGINVDLLQDYFVIGTISSQTLSFLFDDPQYYYDSGHPYTIEVTFDSLNNYEAIFYGSVPPLDFP